MLTSPLGILQTMPQDILLYSRGERNPFPVVFCRNHGMRLCREHAAGIKKRRFFRVTTGRGRYSDELPSPAFPTSRIPISPISNTKFF